MSNAETKSHQKTIAVLGTGIMGSGAEFAETWFFRARVKSDARQGEDAGISRVGCGGFAA